MSQSPGYDFQYSPGPPPKQSSGCMKGCLIAGIILAVLAGLIVIGVIWLGKQIQQGVTNDPEEVAKRLHERYPNAKIPKGYEGKAGIHIKLVMEMDMMVFAKAEADVDEEGQVRSGDSLMFFSLNMPGAKKEDLEEGMQNMNRGGKVVEKRPYTVRTGEYEFEASMQKVQQRHGDGKQTYTQILVPLGGGAVVIMQGNEDKVDEASLKEFLLSIAKDVPVAKKAGQKAPAPEEDDEKPKTKNENK